MSGPWHNTYATNDEYRRESFDGGTTWEAPYKLVGKDGRPGEDGGDGDPKGYLQSIKITEITEDQIKSALIEGAVIRGGRLESETRIDIGTDAYIGNNLYLGRNSATAKGIRFNTASLISVGAGDFGALTISTPILNLSGEGSPNSKVAIKSPELDLTEVDNIKWGNNTVRAVFE